MGKRKVEETDQEGKRKVKETHQVGKRIVEENDQEGKRNWSLIKRLKRKVEKTDQGRC